MGCPGKLPAFLRMHEGERRQIYSSVFSTASILLLFSGHRVSVSSADNPLNPLTTHIFEAQNFRRTEYPSHTPGRKTEQLGE